MALIEIDGLPIKNGGSFHGYVTNNQIVNLNKPSNERKNVETPFLLPTSNICQACELPEEDVGPPTSEVSP